MREEMFLEDGYLDTLRLISEAAKQKNCRWKKIDSTKSAFVLQFERYEDYNPYYLTVFLKPYLSGFYLLFPVSNEYRNPKVVPESVNNIFKRKYGEGKVIVCRQKVSIDDIDPESLLVDKQNNYGFVYWAYVYVDLTSVSPFEFNDLASKFIFESESYADAVEMLYR